MIGEEISDQLFYQIVRVGGLWINTQIDQKFSIVSIDNDRIVCKILSKLKRGAFKTPVEFALTKEMFKNYMSLKKDGFPPIFVRYR